MNQGLTILKIIFQYGEKNNELNCSYQTYPENVYLEFKVNQEIFKKKKKKNLF